MRSYTNALSVLRPIDDSMIAEGINGGLWGLDEL